MRQMYLMCLTLRPNNVCIVGQSNCPIIYNQVSICVCAHFNQAERDLTIKEWTYDILLLDVYQYKRGLGFAMAIIQIPA